MGVAHARAPRGAPHGRHRGDDGAARTGLRERRRLRRSRSASSPSSSIARTTRSSTIARTSSAPTATSWKASRTRRRRSRARSGSGKLIYFYDDNHITIDGTTWISFTEDRARALRGAGLARAARRRRERARRAPCRRSRTRRRRTARPSLIVVHSHIAYPAPHATRHRQVARLAARRGRGARHEGGHGLGSRQDVRRPGRRRRAHERHRARHRARGDVAAEAQRVVGEVSRPARALGPGEHGQAVARLGRGAAASSSPARASPRATPARR